ncbi:acyl CoA binding protein [Oesophagostomum dentatum]|uniref:Acyl CoA binding protein n=1 Tax=Oesophagostomum dentatum TaxID=61180 RepID=A0A0B1TL04_OESDE|nr:acyl CoA binding protein [Oesophagostomum dentatum]
MSLDERFDAAVTIIQKLPKEGPLSTSNDQKLEFYSLYKQATVGDVNTERPGIFSIVERKKWDAWKACEGVSKDDAKERYIKVLLAMFDNIPEDIDMDQWLNEKCDPIIKKNLALDAWKACEGVSKDDAKERYIKVLLAMFDNIPEDIDMDQWLNEKCDPIIKKNLALLGKA